MSEVEECVYDVIYVIVWYRLDITNYITQMRLFLLLTLLSLSLSWSSYQGIRTAQTILISTPLSSSSTPPTYNITYSSSLSGTSSIGLGIVGFNTMIGNDFSFNISVTNFTNSNIQMTARAIGNTIVSYLVVHYIAVGTVTYFLEVQWQCIIPSNLSQGNGTRTQSRTTPTYYTNVGLTCNSYLSGFVSHNSQGLLNYLSTSVTCNNNQLITTFATRENNTFSQICYTVVAFCQICTNTTYYQWGMTGQIQVGLGVNPSTQINVDGRYEDNDRMFWGISGFNLSRGYNKQFNFDSQYYQTGGIDSNYNTNTGTYNIYLSHFFIARRGCNTTALQWFRILQHTVSCVNDGTCNSTVVETLPGSARFCKACHYTCKECDYGAMRENCSLCQNVHHRVLDNSSKTCPCSTSYIDIGISLCYPCSSYISGCDTCYSPSVCSSCLPSFHLTLQGLCQCTSGFLITNVCTSISGCIAATNLAGTIYCTGCNTTGHYTSTTNYSCECMYGYYGDGNGNCVNQCGDGIVVEGEECDDGNGKDGDGCSIMCGVEGEYWCNNSYVPSVCKLHYNVTGTVKWVRRVPGMNTAQFAIQLSPYKQTYSQMQFNLQLQTDMPCASPTLSSTTHSPLLLFTCPYTQSLHLNTYTLSLLLDQNYFTSSSFLQIPSIYASPMNAKLTYDSSTNILNSPCKILVYIMTISAILVYCLSSFTQRMIGVQMIQSLQLVLYYMAIMQVAPAALEPLQMLKYSNGYNQLYGDYYVRQYQVPYSVYQIGLQHQFSTNYNLMYIILAFVIISCLILKIVILKMINSTNIISQQEQTIVPIHTLYPKYHLIRRIYKFMFERVFFLVAFMGIFIVLFSIAIEIKGEQPVQMVMDDTVNVFLAMVAGVIMLGFACLVVVNGVYPHLGIFPMFMAVKYPIYYILYNLLLISILISFYTSSITPFILLTLTLLNTLILLYWRPYPSSLHNFTIILQQITILFAIGLYTLEQYTAKDQNYQLIFIAGFFTVVVLCYTIVILTAIRLVLFYRYMKKKGLDYENGKEGDGEEKKELMTPRTRNKGQEINKDMGKYNSTAMNPFTAYQERYYDDIREAKQRNPLKTSKLDGSKLDSSNLNTRKHHQQDNKHNNSILRKDQDNYDTFNRHNNSSNININSPTNMNSPTRMNSPTHMNRSNMNNMNNTNNMSGSIRMQPSQSILRKQTSNFNIEQIDPQAQQIMPQLDLNSRSPYDPYGNIRPHNPDDLNQEQDALKIIKARLRKDFYQKIKGSQLNISNDNTSRREQMASQRIQMYEPSDLNDQ